jgi:hypothetical protein
MTGKARRGSAPFSIRIPPELRTHVKKMAGDRQISEGAYLCTLIENDIGKRSRRPSTQHVMWREQLRKIHEAIIERGDRVQARQRDCYDHPETDGQGARDELVNITTALLQLEDAVRGK